MSARGQVSAGMHTHSIVIAGGSVKLHRLARRALRLGRACLHRRGSSLFHWRIRLTPGRTGAARGCTGEYCWPIAEADAGLWPLYHPPPYDICKMARQLIQRSRILFAPYLVYRRPRIYSYDEIVCHFVTPPLYLALPEPRQPVWQIQSRQNLSAPPVAAV